MINAILKGIANAQTIQDQEGHEHPNEVQVYSFECPLLPRLLLKLRNIDGLEFEKYQGTWWGIYRARK